MNNFLLENVFWKSFVRIGDKVRTTFLKSLWIIGIFQSCKSHIYSKSCPTQEIFYILTLEWILYKLTKFQTMVRREDPRPFYVMEDNRDRAVPVITHNWGKIIIILFVCLTIFTVVLGLVLRFIIFAPKNTPTDPTTTTTTTTTTTRRTASLSPFIVYCYQLVYPFSSLASFRLVSSRHHD